MKHLSCSLGAVWARRATLLLALGAGMCPVGAQAQTAGNQDTAKPVTAAPADARPTPRPHRVITNDDLPSRTHAESNPEIERHLEQLNFCDHACFQQVFKESSTELHRNWPYEFTPQQNELIEDALLQRLDRLRKDTEWQNRLRNALAEHLWGCSERAKYQAWRNQERASGRSVTAADLEAEEALEKQSTASRPFNYSANQAMLEYRWKFQKDPLTFALMLHQYFAVTKMPCPAAGNADR